MSLQALLLSNPSKRQELERALVQLVENEVAGKQGVEGNLVKMVHATSKKLIPGILPRGINYTLPGLVTDLEPEYALALKAGMPFSQHLLRADRRPIITKTIQRAFDRVVAQHPLLVPVYQLLRLRIEHHAELGLPQLGLVLQPFLS